MRRRNVADAIGSAVILVLSLSAFSACAQSPQSPTTAAEEVDGEPEYASAAIGVGVKEELVRLPVNQEIAEWLNTTSQSADLVPPVPAGDAWHPFAMPSADPFIVFDTGIDTTFDVLEILAYPDGLDEDGIPVSVQIHPLCGPQAKASCKDITWKSSGVRVPHSLVNMAITQAEYYAIAGILLPLEDSHPDSFMVLVKNEAREHSRSGSEDRGHE